MLWTRVRYSIVRTLKETTLDDLIAAFAERPVFASAPFCEREECEVRIKEAVHAATVRVIRADRRADGAPCVACGEPADGVALIARAY